MHPYATDSTERTIVPLLLAGLAIPSAWALAQLLNWLGWSWLWWADLPSVLGFYGLYHWFFDAYLWRWNIARRTGLVKVPDLNGDWTAALVSTFKGTHIDATLRIHQRWRSLVVHFTGEHSRSSSRVAAILVNNPDEYVLMYEFLNTPSPTALDTMHMHRGTVEVRFQRQDYELVGDGEYYSGRDRENQGTMHIERTRPSAEGNGA